MTKKKQTKASSIDVYCAHDKIMDIEDLVPNPRNPNTHPDEQIALLAKIIRAQGWRNPIVISDRTGFTVKGHGRLEAARLLNVSTVPVDIQHYENDAAEWADMIADNRIAELAEIDSATLQEVLNDLGESDWDMDLTGFTAPELALLLSDGSEDNIDAPPQTDRAEELQKEWGVKPGQIWNLGKHRLMCGDSTKKKDVDRLLDGNLPLLMVTDPPYGVEYNAAWRNDALAGKLRANGKKKGGGRAVGKVTNDNRADWSAAYSLFKGDVAYIWHSGNKSGIFQSSLESAGFDIRWQIIWAKQHLVIGRGAYHPKHEPCFYAVRKGSKSHWIGDRKQTTLWEIDKPHKSETGHSTQKPLECMARPIRHHSSDYIYDPFSGTGTTILACENLGRTCCAMDIEASYVAITLQRYMDATGDRPTLIKRST